MEDIITTCGRVLRIPGNRRHQILTALSHAWSINCKEKWLTDPRLDLNPHVVARAVYWRQTDLVNRPPRDLLDAMIEVCKSIHIEIEMPAHLRLTKGVPVHVRQGAFMAAQCARDKRGVTEEIARRLDYNCDFAKGEFLVEAACASSS